MTKQASTFATEVVVCIEPHAGALADGTEFVCHFGERFRADREEVLRNPQYFVADGERLVPYSRPLPPDEPPPPPKPRPRVLRVKKTWESDVRELPSPFGPPERITISLHEGRTIPLDTPWLPALTARERRELLEEVEAT